MDDMNGPTRSQSLVQMQARNSTYKELNGGEDRSKETTKNVKKVIFILAFFLVLALAAIVILVVLYTNAKHSENELRANSEEICPCGAFDVPAASQSSPDKIRGVNIGGFLVLEPNVSPSLFYQFMGEAEPAVDMRHFCENLGPTESNKQLRRFWETWVTREDIEFLASTGINTLRVPVGYWMFQEVPDKTYKGCVDGSMEQLIRLINLAKEFGLKIVIDLHAAKNSQNGFDNSAWTRDTIFDPNLPGTYIRSLNPQWLLNQTVVDETVDQLAAVAKCFTCEATVSGLSVLNEPFFLDPEALKVYYTNAYRKVKQIAPHWKIQASDDFQNMLWGGFWVDDEFNDGAIDTHIYQIFEDGLLQNDFEFHLNFACEHANDLNTMEAIGAATIVGEWSLATDDCAMWLLGLNQVSRYSQLNTPANCSVTKCPGSEGHASPRPGLDGPDGEGNCPIDAEIDDGFLEAYGLRQLHSYEQASGGWFYWNFKSELEPRWSWIQSVKNGWLPSDISDIENNEDVITACDVEATTPPITTPPIIPNPSGGMEEQEEEQEAHEEEQLLP